MGIIDRTELDRLVCPGHPRRHASRRLVNRDNWRSPARQGSSIRVCRRGQSKSRAGMSEPGTEHCGRQGRNAAWNRIRRLEYLFLNPTGQAQRSTDQPLPVGVRMLLQLACRSRANGGHSESSCNPEHEGAGGNCEVGQGVEEHVGPGAGAILMIFSILF